jgi:hypothetical protein
VIALIAMLVTAAAFVLQLHDRLWPGRPTTSTALASPADKMCDASSDGYVESGWYPQRPIYEDNTFPDHLTFNSTAHNHVIGDERNWVRVRDAKTEDEFVDRIEAKPGQLYDISGYVHLDGPEDQMATDTSLAFEIPDCTAHLIAIRGILDSISTFPKEVENGVEFWAREDFHLSYVPDSAILENNVGKFPLPNSIVAAGSPIGVKQMDGVFEPGYGNAAYVTFTVRADFGSR